MKKHLALLLLAHFLPANPAHAENRVMTRDQIIAEGQKMADAQIALLAKKKTHASPDWELGVLWAGFADFYKVSGDPKIHEILLQSGEQFGWKPIVSYPHLVEKMRLQASNADDLCIGQAWLAVYEETKNPIILAGIKERIEVASDFIQADAESLAAPDRRPGDLRVWSWCDALFMAPAVHAHLSSLTGDPKYRNAMHTEWWRASAVMYDETEHLYFRDAGKIFPKKATQSGKKVFWARGNGWVMGGLARVLAHLPKDDPMRPRYEQQFQQMSARLASLQRPDGTWSASLLDYDEFPFSESSGTALNCFAMAWGINHGLLDEKTYRPVVEKAWAALLAARRPDGLLGYVQSVAHGPAKVFADGNRTYGTGAFLMAAAQLAKLAPLNLPPAPHLEAMAAPVAPEKNNVPTPL